MSQTVNLALPSSPLNHFSEEMFLVTVCERSESSDVAEQSCSRDLLPGTSKDPVNRARTIKNQSYRKGECWLLLSLSKELQVPTDPRPSTLVFLNLLKRVNSRQESAFLALNMDVSEVQVSGQRTLEDEARLLLCIKVSPLQGRSYM